MRVMRHRMRVLQGREAEALQEVEALDNAVVEEADAEVSKFEDISLDKERKLPAAVESLECAVSDNQG